MNQKLKIGLFGAGHLGKIHLKCLQETDFEIVGIYDPDSSVQQYIKSNFPYKVYEDADALIVDCDAVDIVSTTTSHFEIAKKALEMGRHAFIEKPICSTLDEAKELKKNATKNKLRIQVGHVERYNPAIRSLQDRAISPKFIEGHRLATFNSRGNEVSVVLDIMIHDLDIVLDLVKSKVVDVQANGVCVVSDTPDICNARLTFANGCVANLTASRISMKQMRKLRLFQENEYISIDFLNKECQIIKLHTLGENEEADGMTIQTSAGKKAIEFVNPEIEESNAIVEELRDFYNAISHNTPIRVGVTAAISALELAKDITEAMDS